jgi:hypothetical protein
MDFSESASNSSSISYTQILLPIHPGPSNFVQGAGIAALSKEGDEAVERMRAIYDKRRKLLVEMMRGVGFIIQVIPQGAFYVFADASKWTDDSYAFPFALLEKTTRGVARAWPSAKRGSGRSGSAMSQTRSGILHRYGQRHKRRQPRLPTRPCGTPLERNEERVAGLKEVLERRTETSALLLRKLLGEIRLEPKAGTETGRPYYLARTSLDALEILEPPPGGPEEGSKSLRWWTRSPTATSRPSAPSCPTPASTWAS